MSVHTTGRLRPATDFIDAARDHEQRQRHQSSTFDLATGLNRLIALGLVGSSTTFGAVYAYQSSHSTNEIMAWAAVAMAVSLEVAKPQALAAALSATRAVSHRFALGLLAVVACVYSLTAELSLMATSRGDVVASRQQTINDTNDAGRQRTILETELASLTTTQPAEIASKQSKLIADNPTARCDADKDSKDYGTTSKRVCPLIEALNAERREVEKSQARRAELTSLLGGMSAPHTEPPAVDKADPGASALSLYLAVLGVAVKPDVLAEWLVLVPVIALELGSLFAGLLVASTPLPVANSVGEQSVRGTPKIDVVANTSGVQAKALETLAANTLAEQLQTVPFAVVPMVPLNARSANDAATRLVEYVRQHGGVVQISTRKMASEIACKHGTLNDAVLALETGGVLTAEPKGRAGTVYRLSKVSASALQL
jgi:hypothetical protein